MINITTPLKNIPIFLHDMTNLLNDNCCNFKIDHSSFNNVSLIGNISFCGLIIIYMQSCNLTISNTLFENLNLNSSKCLSNVLSHNYHL